MPTAGRMPHHRECDARFAQGPGRGRAPPRCLLRRGPTASVEGPLYLEAPEAAPLLLVSLGASPALLLVSDKEVHGAREGPLEAPGGPPAPKEGPPASYGLLVAASEAHKATSREAQGPPREAAGGPLQARILGALQSPDVALAASPGGSLG